jgi:hypothetical protein
MAKSVYVLTLASPDQVESSVYAHAAKCRTDFQNLVNGLLAKQDEVSMDMVLNDEEDHGDFFDGYGINMRWQQEEIVE